MVTGSGEQDLSAMARLMLVWSSGSVNVVLNMKESAVSAIWTTASANKCYMDKTSHFDSNFLLVPLLSN